MTFKAEGTTGGNVWLGEVRGTWSMPGWWIN